MSVLTDIDTSVDTSWCPVCDRAILPIRVQVPVPVPNPPPTLHQKHKSAKPTTGGLVNGTGRGLRRAPLSQHQKHPSPVPEPNPPQVKMRTVICQDIPYYCSEECRERDLQEELDNIRLSQRLPFGPYSDERDEPIPLRVPQNTPAEDRHHSPSSPNFTSSGTESDSSSISTSRSRLDDPASYSPLSILRNLPPLPRKPSKKPNTPPPSHYGVMMAAQRIKEAFQNPLPPSNSNSPHKGDVVLPGWTDGDRTQWRSSVYGGVEIIPNPDYRPPTTTDAYTGGAYSAQGARRAAGLDESTVRRPYVTVGQSAPQPSTRILHENFANAFKRTNSSSQLSTEQNSPTETSTHPLLSNSLKGKLLVPQIRSGPPSRSGSSASLSSCFKREPTAVSSPLAQPPVSRKKKEGRSWSYDDQPLFELPPRIARKNKQLKEVWVPSPENQCGVAGSGEGKWEKTEVEAEVNQQRKRLFLFGA